MSLIYNLPNPPLDPPLLHPGFAIGASTLFTFTYVASLYLHPAGRLTNTRDASGRLIDRDHPRVIRARIKTASLATALTLLATAAGLWWKGVVPTSAGWLLGSINAARLLGVPVVVPSVLGGRLIPVDPPMLAWMRITATHVAAPLLLTGMLFLGPLYVSYLDQELPFQRRFSYHRDVVHRFTSLAGLRNYLVGPLTEELVFRSSILTPLVLAGVSRCKLIFATPAFFGIAHIHHAYNVWLQGGRTRQAAVRGGAIAVVQLAYTGVFGWYANFLFLRSGGVLAGCAAHVLCNVMGLPDPVAAQKRHTKNALAIWTSHAIGIALFAKYLWPLTSSTVFGGSLYWQ